MTLQHIPPSESLDFDSEVVSSSHELLNSSPSRTSLAAFRRAWLTTLLVKSALFPLILRPCCFKYIFSWLFVSASTSFSFFQEILDGREFLSLTPFHAFASKNSRFSTCVTFTRRTDNRNILRSKSEVIKLRQRVKTLKN